MKFTSQDKSFIARLLDICKVERVYYDFIIKFPKFIFEVYIFTLVYLIYKTSDICTSHKTKDNYISQHKLDSFLVMCVLQVFQNVDELNFLVLVSLFGPKFNLIFMPNYLL